MAAAQTRLKRLVSVPNGVRLGPLVSTIRDGAAWAKEDEFPSDQTWADEVERVLSFTQMQGQFANYLGRLRGSAKQRYSALAELRTAFFLSRNSFPIVEWEPLGANSKKGEFFIRTPNSVDIFTEVKSPSWEGELSPEEITNGRKDQGKILDGEARMIAPWERV